MSALGDHRKEVSFCAYCPKLCRFSCPVSNADRKESHTPWGKMTAAYQHLTESRPLDESTGKAIYACTGCLRCKTNCRHGNEVGPALFAARAEAVTNRVAPEPVDKLEQRFREGGRFDRELEAAAARFTAETAGAASSGGAYFPGCTALRKAPEVVTAAIDAAAGFGVKLAVTPLSGVCCGYPLWAAGLRTQFEKQARAFAEASANVRELVVGDPGCAYTLLRGFQEVGVTLETKIVLLVDVLADRLEFAIGRAPLPLDASYHDSCHLGRGLGRYESPRRLLRASVGDFFEAAENRADAGCSGGGGVLPLTMPETALEVARNQALEQGAPGHSVVTVCPSARRMFEKAGTPAHDLYSVLAHWIAGRQLGQAASGERDVKQGETPPRAAPTDGRP